MTIYDYNFDENMPMKQGDIFSNLPYLSYDLLLKSTYEDDKPTIDQSDELISEILKTGDIIQVETFLASTWGILANQDCDIRDPYDLIFLPLKEISPSVAVSTLNYFNKRVRDTTRFFYLPAIKKPSIGNLGPFHAQFNMPFTLPFNQIEKNIKSCWVARIKEPSRRMLVAKLTHFFSRPPIDELIFAENQEIENYIKNFIKKNKQDKEKIIEKLEEIKRTLHACGREKDIAKISFEKLIRNIS